MVRSFVSCANSCGLFCRFRPRPKKEAMLSGKSAVRRSWGETGDDVRGCDLFAGPGRSYLDGASIRFIEGKGCYRKSEDIEYGAWCCVCGVLCYCNDAGQPWLVMGALQLGNASLPLQVQ
jgi:hypothetical protein